MGKEIDNFGCNLYIGTEEDSPEIITKLTGIQASEIIVKGRPFMTGKPKREIPGKFNKENLWIYEGERLMRTSGIYLNDAVHKLLTVLDAKQNIFVDLFRKYPLNHLLCYAYYYDYNPYFLFDKNLMQRLAMYNIDMEFDLYFLGDADEH
jgi:hypothetical protein